MKTDSFKHISAKPIISNFEKHKNNEFAHFIRDDE